MRVIVCSGDADALRHEFCLPCQLTSRPAFVVSFALVARFAAVVLAVLLAVAAGCGGGSDDDAAQLVQDSAARTGEVETFHFVLDVRSAPVESTGLRLTSAEGDVVVPERAVSTDVSGTFAGISLTTQLIAIGDDVWLKDPLTRDWTKLDVNTTPISLLDPAEGILGVMSRVENAETAGTEEIDGVTVRRITGTAKASDVAPLVAVSSPRDAEVDITLWIGEDDQLLRRVEVSGAVGEEDSPDAVRSFEVSRFDEPVAVEPPEGTG
jgi:hypothetical protein